MSFRAVQPGDALWEGEMTRVEADGVGVLLVRIEGQVRAYRDACLHKGLPLSGGTLCGRHLTCSAHQWQYDLVAGCGVNPANVRLISIPVRVRDGRIEINPEIDPTVGAAHQSTAAPAGAQDCGS